MEEDLFMVHKFRIVGHGRFFLSFVVRSVGFLAGCISTTTTEIPTKTPTAAGL
jgi:hypothetical protein